MSEREKNRPILPGATIGVLGSGQLGRMFTIAAKQMGYRVNIFSPTHDSPAGQVADLEIQAAYDDADAVSNFAKNVDVITLEFENVPVSTIDVANQFAPVHPGRQVLETTQHRYREKSFLKNNGIPVAGFSQITSLEELKLAGEHLIPGVLKTTTLGYDGKGQVAIRDNSELESAWQSLDSDESILEKFIDLECEFSVIAARSSNGSWSAYDPIRNDHRNHILDVSVSPSGLSGKLIGEALEITRTIMEQLNVIGVLCVEFFLSKQGELMVNELAPRAHNSGHLTIDAHVTSQFEQQVRAVCGLGLGSVEQQQPAAMVNLLGDCWNSGEPNWSLGLSLPNVKLHLYGKEAPEPKRKMGHLTALADSAEQAIEQALAARNLIQTESPNHPVPDDDERRKILQAD